MTLYQLTDSISDLLGVEVRERGINALLFCPLHYNIRTPSFSIHLEEGVWHCFGCGKKGNLEQLYFALGERMNDGLVFERAKKRAQESNNEELLTIDFTPQANDYCNSITSEDGRRALSDYCTIRPIQPARAIDFGVGYDTDSGALTYPYLDRDERVIGIKFRYQSGSKGSLAGSKYGLYGPVLERSKKVVVIGEGESDTLALRSALPEYVGICGTSGASVSEAQWVRFSLDLFYAQRVFLVYDADDSGDRCADTAMRVLGDHKSKRIRPTKGADLSEHLQNGGTLDEIGLGTADLHV